jgi:hypothetical protein
MLGPGQRLVTPKKSTSFPLSKWHKMAILEVYPIGKAIFRDVGGNDQRLLFLFVPSEFEVPMAIWHPCKIVAEAI